MTKTYFQISIRGINRNQLYDFPLYTALIFLFLLNKFSIIAISTAFHNLHWTLFLMMLVVRCMIVDHGHGLVSHNVELLHVHDASSAVDKCVVIYLGDVSVSGEDILLRPIRILILVKFLANNQTINIRIVTIF